MSWAPAQTCPDLVAGAQCAVIAHGAEIKTRLGCVALIPHSLRVRDFSQAMRARRVAIEHRRRKISEGLSGIYAEYGSRGKRQSDVARVHTNTPSFRVCATSSRVTDPSAPQGSTGCAMGDVHNILWNIPLLSILFSSVYFYFVY